MEYMTIKCDYFHFSSYQIYCRHINTFFIEYDQYNPKEFLGSLNIRWLKRETDIEETSQEKPTKTKRNKFDKSTRFVEISKCFDSLKRVLLTLTPESCRLVCGDLTRCIDPSNKNIQFEVIDSPSSKSPKKKRF